MPNKKLKCQCAPVLFTYRDVDLSINQVKLNGAGFVLKQWEVFMVVSNWALYRNLHFPI